MLLDHLREEIPKLARKTDVALFDDWLKISAVLLPAETAKITHGAASAPAGAEAAETQNLAAGFDNERSAPWRGAETRG